MLGKAAFSSTQWYKPKSKCLSCVGISSTPARPRLLMVASDLPSPRSERAVSASSSPAALPGLPGRSDQEALSFSQSPPPSPPVSGTCALTLSVCGQQPTISQETQSTSHLPTVSSPCTPFDSPEHSDTSLQTYLLRARGGISTEDRNCGSVGVDLVCASKAEAVSLAVIVSRGSPN